MINKSNNILLFQKELSHLNLDYFLLPNNDEFLNEYLPESEKRLEFITNFSGSNAYAIIGQNKSAFFTDGRYTTQAKQQVNSNSFEIYNLSEKTPIQWLKENTNPKDKIGFDPKLHNKAEIDLYSKEEINLFTLESNPIDIIWTSKKNLPNSKIFVHPNQYTGLTLEEKHSKIINNLDDKSDALILNCPSSICWLLNIRGSDVELPS